MGTGGVGLAVDLSGPHRYAELVLTDPYAARAEQLAVFDAFRPVEHLLHELICAHAPYNIKAGVQVKPYAVSDHGDHNHVSVDRGVIIPAPESSPSPAPTVVIPFPGENMTRHDLTIPTDGNGNGWAWLNVPAGNVVSIVVQGAYPPVDGYWNLPVVGRQDRDGKTVVQVSETAALVNVRLSVWTTG